MGFFDKITGRRPSRPARSPRKSRRSISDSANHEDKQVLGFKPTVKGDGKEPNMSRDLFSVPMSDKVESMVDHLQAHTPGDIFPYVSVYGNEDESKDSRLSRLRAFKSPYGKENKPDVRLNGVVLMDTEGVIRVQDLKDYVNGESLTRSQTKENKRFKPLKEESFKKPYIHIARITGEYVPLMSSTADYTDLHFTLEDGRLLEHTAIVQSNTLPTNQNGVFELSCDYCINVSDLSQLSLKYFLSRPVMKEGFQWGSVSLTIRMSEADTPYIAPKVEAMAVVRMPFSTLEDQKKNPDHADVVYTSKDIEKYREMYRSGDIADIDEPKQAKMKLSTYSKSSIRGQAKAVSGPGHLGEQDGWEHLKNMRKPLLPEGEASVSAESTGEEDLQVSMPSKLAYEKHQEELRRGFSTQSDSTEDIPSEEIARSPSPEAKRLKPALKKTRFSEEPLEAPSTENVYVFN